MKYLLKNRTSGNRTSGDRTVFVVSELVARSLEQDSKSIWPHLVQL